MKRCFGHLIKIESFSPSIYCFLKESIVKNWVEVSKKGSELESIIPRLRKDIKITPTLYEGQRAFVVRDDLGLIREPLLLYGELLSFLSLVDGHKNISDIQLDLIRLRGGSFVSSEEVKKVLFELNSLFMLDSERYRQEKKKIIDSYAQVPVRSAFHSGRSYPNDPDEIRKMLDSFLSEQEEISIPFEDERIAALVAPHIDLKVGKKIYAKAYQAIRKCDPDRVILLGTGHNLYGSLFSLTEKDFETPFGLVKTDKEWVKRLRKKGKDLISPSDVAHRSEHSLEFQLLFLQYLFGSEFSLLPVLCGTFDKSLETASRPREMPKMEKFLGELKLCSEEKNSRNLIVAGVDLSHIGPKFGHTQRASTLLFEAKNHDKILLDALCKGNIEEFWAESSKVKNKYNVCGLSALACLLEIQDGQKGYLLDYDFWQEEQTQSAVSFAALIIERM